MKAKEMFEELGYEYHYSLQGLAYDVLCVRNFNNGDWQQIEFHYGKYTANDRFGNECMLHSFNKDEHLAIHQQMKELGWIE